MSILHGFLGNASNMNKKEAKKEVNDLLMPDEEIEAAFKLIRDLIVFTDKRLIMVDKQGLSGKKIDFHSIPYKSISHFSVETAGTFDLDSELKIWISSAQEPTINKKFKKDKSIFDIQKILAALSID